MIRCLKKLKKLTANAVPHNSVNKFSFLPARLKRLLSNSAINPFPFLKFGKASLSFSAVRSEPFSQQLGRRCVFCNVAGMDRNKSLRAGALSESSRKALLYAIRRSRHTCGKVLPLLLSFHLDDRPHAGRHLYR